jgi:prolyl oligopeptidase
MRKLTIFCLCVLWSTIPLIASDEKPSASPDVSAVGALTPPATPIREVTDEYFGTKIIDPYRWLEDLRSPEVSAWMKAQNDYTRALLDRIPSRDKLQARIAGLDQTGVRVSGLQSFGGHWFYLKQTPGDDNRRLYVRDAGAGNERLLINPESLTQNGAHYSIDFFQPSLDGKLVAVGISPGGSENAVLRVIEADTGRDLGERIDRTQFGSITWLPDNRSFFYNRLQKLAPGAPRTDYYLNSRVYLHRLGNDPDKDVAVFGRGVSTKVDMAPADFPFIALPPGSKYAIAVDAHGVQNEVTAYAAKLEDVRDAQVPWQKIADVDGEITSFDIHGDSIYFLSHKNASRYKVLRADLRSEHPDPEVVIPSSDAVVVAIAAGSDALYVDKLDAGLGRLWRLPFDAGAATQIPLPFDGAIQELVTNPTEPGVFVRLASWTKSAAFFHYDPQSKTLADTQIIPPSPVDFSAITSEEVKATTSDGTQVPLSIIHRRDLKLDSSHPALLHGYGAYGVNYDPAFDPTSLAWLERGGVIAFAHVRGGGENGEDWHKGGQKATKINTITDFISCAEYLVSHKYTSPSHLAGEGTSAGGITIGGAITERPDLFGAALDNVGDSDLVRSELQISGPANIPEFGTVKNEDDFHSMLKISGYHRVKDHTAYPAVLLTTGVNDPRVDPWQMSKMTARLQAATSSGKPVLLRVDYDAGHGGIGATRSQHTALLTDQFSFLLWQLGDPDFQADKSATAKIEGQK